MCGGGGGEGGGCCCVIEIFSGYLHLYVNTVVMT